MSTLKVDTIQHSGGTSGLTIDSSGRVSRSLIPSWRVALDGDQNETTASTYITVGFNKSSSENCFLAGGCTLSSGVITVPVAGLYFFTTLIRFDQVTSTDHLAVRVTKNNAISGAEEYTGFIDDHGASYHSVTISGLYQCNASDELAVKGYVNNDTSWHFASDGCFFSGYMVG